MQSLLKLSRGIDAFTRWTGKRLAWLILRRRRGVRGSMPSFARSSTPRRTPGSSCNGCCSASCSCCARRGRCSTTNTSGSTSSINLLPKRVRDSIDVVGHVFFLLPLCDHHDHHRRSVLSAFVRDQRAVGQCRRAAAMAGQIADHDRVSFACCIQGLSELIKRIAIMRDLIPDPHAIAGARPRSRGRAHRRSDRKTLIAGSGRRGNEWKRFSSHNMAPIMFGVAGRLPAARLSGGVLARRGRPDLRAARHRARPVRARLPAGACPSASTA